MPDELAKTLLVEEVIAPNALADALFASVSRGVPVVRALTEAGSVPRPTLARYAARTGAPTVERIAPADDVIAQLPLGLCARLLAVPIRPDGDVGIAVAVADPTDPHPAREIAFHLGTEVKVVHVPLDVIEQTLAQHGLDAAPTVTNARPTAFGGEAEAGAPRRPTPPWGARPRLDASEPPRSRESDVPIPLMRHRPAAPSFLSSPNDSSTFGKAVERSAAEVSLDVLTALRAAARRDEVLDLILEGAHAVAAKVALFVKRNGYVGWACSPELGERAAIQAFTFAPSGPNVFDDATRDGSYLGPLPHDEVHAPLVALLREPSNDVAVVTIRVSGKPAVFIVADDLEDTMVGTRRLEEIARIAGESFGRILRMRR